MARKRGVSHAPASGHSGAIPPVSATSEPSVGSAPWWAARSLAERREGAAAQASDAGRRRRDAWRATFADDDLFAARIAAAGVADVEALAAVLSDTAPLPGVVEPEWWTVVERALTVDPSGVRSGADLPDAADLPHGGRRIAAFFAAYARRCLDAHPRTRADVARPLADGLVRGLAAMCRRLLALELEATRLVEGWTADETAERSAALMRGFGDPRRTRELLSANPGLARLVADRTALTIDAGLEVLDRLHADLERVSEELLGGADTAQIHDLKPLGDRHDGGRRVLALTFSSGARAMLKPRSLAADVAYGNLLSALNALGFAPAFRPIPTLATGPHHGWQAYVEAQSCTDEGGVERYFRRFGGQLAVLYALRATDMHQENVIACGEHPMIIDLETLLQPRLGGAAAADVDPLIGESAIDSVLRVGLLPRPDGPMGADISGIGRDPLARAHVADDGWTTKVQGGAFVAVDGRLPLADNAVRLHGRPVRPHEHVDALARGFEDAYRLLLDHHRQLLRAGGPLAAFGDVEVRLILRATQAYIFILQRQVTDDGCLSDGLARERALDVLWRAASGRPDLRAAAPAEHHDLWRGDVPKLTARPGENALHHHALGPIADALGDEGPPGPEVVARLSERDLARQLSFLRTAVLASAAGDAGAVGTPPAAATSRRSTIPPPEPRRLRAAADAAAARLADLALHDGDEAGWLTLVLRRPPRDGCVLAGAGPDLADGQAGIALFLFALDPQDALTQAAIARLRRLLAEGGHPDDEHRAGLALALAVIDGRPAAAAPAAADDGDPAAQAWALAARALDAAQWPPRGIETPGLRDGLAGIGLACLALAQPAPPPWMLEALAVASREPRRIEDVHTSSRPADAAPVRAPGA